MLFNLGYKLVLLQFSGLLSLWTLLKIRTPGCTGLLPHYHCCRDLFWCLFPNIFSPWSNLFVCFVSWFFCVFFWFCFVLLSLSLQARAGKQKKDISLAVCRWTASGIDYGVGKSGWLIGYHLPQRSNVLLQESRVSFHANWENHQGRKLFIYSTKKPLRYFVKFQKRGLLVCDIAKIILQCKFLSKWRNRYNFRAIEQCKERTCKNSHKN